MNRYPFLTACMPDIEIGQRPDVSFQEMQEFLSMNLASADRKKVADALQWIDIDNVKAFWLGLNLNERGSMNAKELEEALLVKEFLPPFLIDFLDAHETTEERLRTFSELYVKMYEEMSKRAKGLTRDYYQMEREIRLVLLALRAKKGGRDLVRELQFEDLDDPFVIEILVQKDAPDYIPPQEYEPLKEMFFKNSSDPMKLHRGLLEYRFHRILDMEETYFSFSIDRILGFLLRLAIVEMCNQLDEANGLALIDDLSRNG